MYDPLNTTSNAEIFLRDFLDNYPDLIQNSEDMYIQYYTYTV